MTPQKVHHLTPFGLRRVREEFRELEKKRMEFVQEDGEDRDELDLLEKRLHDLSLVLQSHELISVPPKRYQDTVRLGATVFAHCVKTGRTHEVQLVGTFEANPFVGKISNESPFGQALLGKRVGDVVQLGNRENLQYRILNISYSLRDVHRA